MEDAYVIASLDGLENHCFLAILDGHAGTGAAKMASQQIKDIFCNTQQWKEYVDEVIDGQVTSLNSASDCSDIEEGEVELNGSQEAKATHPSNSSSSPLLKESSRKRCDSNRSVRSVRTVSTDSTGSVVKRKRGDGGQSCNLLTDAQLSNLSDGLRGAFVAMDQQLLESDRMDQSGSTLVCAVITPGHILCANVGDSRAVLSCGSHGEVVALSSDHKPTNVSERERIEGAGCFVAIDRVNGELAMSRALGDFRYKQAKHVDISHQAVTCVPEITFHRRSPGDDLLVLACDGVWDVLSNEELISFVRDHLLKGNCHITMEEAAEAVVDLSLRQGSTDNISAIVAHLNPAMRESSNTVSIDKSREEESLRSSHSHEEDVGFPRKRSSSNNISSSSSNSNSSYSNNPQSQVGGNLTRKVTPQPSGGPAY